MPKGKVEILVGEDGLATVLTMIKGEIWKQSSIAPVYQSFYAPIFCGDTKPRHKAFVRKEYYK